MEACQGFVETVRSFSARNTPAEALMLVELHHPQREFHHAGLIVQNHHTAGAEKFSALGKRIKIQVDAFRFFRSQQEGGRSAGNHRFQLAAIGNAAANLVNQLLHRIPEWKLINPGILYMAAQTEQTRATILRWSIIGKLLSAHQDDVRD